MPSDLRCELDYLKQLLIHALRLHRPCSLEEATLLADIRDYLMYLCLDAINDEDLAKTLVAHFTRLGAWLEQRAKDTPAWTEESAHTQFYMGFVFALDQLLSLRHEIARLPGENINRQDFTRSWRRTAEKLGLA